MTCFDFGQWNLHSQTVLHTELDGLAVDETWLIGIGDDSEIHANM